MDEHVLETEADWTAIDDHTHTRTHTGRCGGDVLTELRDAAHAGGQQGLFQRPQLQLGIGILPAVRRRRLLVLRVGAEVSRQGQHTCGEEQHTEGLALDVHAGFLKQRKTSAASFTRNGGLPPPPPQQLLLLFMLGF